MLPQMSTGCHQPSTQSFSDTGVVRPEALVVMTTYLNNALGSTGTRMVVLALQSSGPSVFALLTVMMYESFTIGTKL